MNPYWGADFFSFFQTLAQRIFSACTGSVPSLAADEIQLIVLSLVALSCGWIGPFLVLKRMAMFANSLSHTILLGIALAYLIASKLWGGGIFDLSTLLIGALIAALFTALCTEGLIRVFRLQEDASIGLVFTAFFALGIVVVTLFTKNVHLGTEAVMGNVDVLQKSDCLSAAFLAGLNLVCLLLFLKPFQIASFDRSLAFTLGIPCGRFHFLLLFLAAATCIGAFRAVGVLLVLAFLVGPYLIARLFCHRLKWLLFWSPVVGVLISAAGVALSRHFLSVFGIALSTGGMVVTLMGFTYLVAVIIHSFVTKKSISIQRN